jgi:hypothetical protein
MKISDGTQVKIGSVGYIVCFDLTEYDISDILGVQVRTTEEDWSKPVNASTDYVTMSEYIDDSEAPDLAFFWMRNTLYIYVNSKYTWQEDALLNFWYYRNAQNISALVDDNQEPVYVDIPGELEQLGLSLILRKVYIDLNTTVPQSISQQIRTHCTNLNIKYPL